MSEFFSKKNGNGVGDVLENTFLNGKVLNGLKIWEFGLEREPSTGGWSPRCTKSAEKRVRWRENLVEESKQNVKGKILKGKNYKGKILKGKSKSKNIREKNEEKPKSIINEEKLKIRINKQNRMVERSVKNRKSNQERSRKAKSREKSEKLKKIQKLAEIDKPKQINNFLDIPVQKPKSLLERYGMATDWRAARYKAKKKFKNSVRRSAEKEPKNEEDKSMGKNLKILTDSVGKLAKPRSKIFPYNFFP